MIHNPDQPATGTGDAEDVVSVVCGHTFFDQQLNRYAFVFHLYGRRQRFTLHHTNPVRYRLGRTYRLTLTPLPDRPGEHPPAQETDPAADAA